MDLFGRQSQGQRYAMPDLKLIPPDVLAVLYDVLYGGLDKSASAGRLRGAARNICRAAYDRECPVERMLVELKAEWSTALDAFHFPGGSERTELTNRFIGFCIEEYFHAGDAEDYDCRGTGLTVVATTGSRLDIRGIAHASLNETGESHRI